MMVIVNHLAFTRRFPPVFGVGRSCVRFFLGARFFSNWRIVNNISHIKLERERESREFLIYDKENCLEIHHVKNYRGLLSRQGQYVREAELTVESRVSRSLWILSSESSYRRHLISLIWTMYVSSIHPLVQCINRSSTSISENISPYAFTIDNIFRYFHTSSHVNTG